MEVAEIRKGSGSAGTTDNLAGARLEISAARQHRPTRYGRADLPVRRNFAADKRSDVGGLGAPHCKSPPKYKQAPLASPIPRATRGVAGVGSIHRWRGAGRDRGGKPAFVRLAAPVNLAGARLDITAAQQHRPTKTR